MPGSLYPNSVSFVSASFQVRFFYEFEITYSKSNSPGRITASSFQAYRQYVNDTVVYEAASTASRRRCDGIDIQIVLEAFELINQNEEVKKRYCKSRY